MSEMKECASFLFSMFICVTALLFTSCVTTAVDDTAAVTASKEYRKDFWIEDFQQLLTFMNDGYANLEWQRDHLHLNLPEMRRQTLAALSVATSDAEAQRILSRFLELFRDSHLHLNLKASLPTAPFKSLNKEEEGSAVCQALGMRNKDNSFRFTPNSSYQKLSNTESPFRYGILKTGKGTIGILRVASFVPRDYAALCVDEWNRYRKKLKDVCNKECVETFTSEVMGNRLLREADRAVADLNRKAIDALLVDITHNGGGTDWEVGFRNMLTSKQLECGGRGFIRHAHWVKQFDDELLDLRESLGKTPSESDSVVLNRKISEAEQNRDEAKKTCKQDALWTDASFKPTCSQVALRVGDSCDIWPGYRYNTGLYNGPLFVLVDSYTASASEDLAARYQDSDAATIIGERTLGAGCGYTNGGIPYVLKHSNIRVNISDCVRYRKNGDNEVAGVTPDIELDMKPIKEPEFFERLISEIEKRRKI